MSFKFPPSDFHQDHILNLPRRYIDQYQELLDWPSSTIERSDWEVYQQAIRAGTGDTEIPLDENFVVYVDCANRKDTTFNYEKWIAGAAYRRS